ncbi:MAG: hypothetical protein COB77_03535 [Gammaproteobacteria bacterium]|nr:MAG: hypothetical protein COB77_03535 [Gammaproteobacteria bacterium]
MLSSQATIKLRQISHDSSLSPRYVLLCDAIIIPVLCVCMIAAMGLISVGRHVTNMQFDVDADTEYIGVIAMEYSHRLHVSIEDKIEDKII